MPHAGKWPSPAAALYLALTLALTLGSAGCAPTDQAPDPGTQAVIIGIDGADWKIID